MYVNMTNENNSEEYANVRLTANEKQLLKKYIFFYIKSELVNAVCKFAGEASLINSVTFVGVEVWSSNSITF